MAPAAKAATPTAATSNYGPGIYKRVNNYLIDPDMVDVDQEWNNRFDLGNLEELADSIKAQKEIDGIGITREIEVKRLPSGRFMLRTGHRRIAAVRILQKRGETFEQGIPAKILDKNISLSEELKLLVRENSGKTLLPLEEAAAYKRMMEEAKMKPKDIALAASRSVGHVKWTLNLLTADASVQAAVESGEISAVMGKTIATKAKGDTAKQKELVATAKQGKAGKRLAKEQAQKIQRRPTKKASQKDLVEKLKMLTESQVGTRLTLALNQLKKDCAALDIAEDNLRTACAADDGRAAAFHYGVSLALRAVLGQDVKISL